MFDTLVGHSCRTIRVGHFAGHSCGKVLWNTLVGHSCRTLAGHFYGTLLSGTLVGHSCKTLLLKPPHVSKTSVSYETSSKTHTSSLQNERFVRDFLQKSKGTPHRTKHIQLPCQAVSRFQLLQTTMSQRQSPPFARPHFQHTQITAPATKGDRRRAPQPHDSRHLPRNCVPHLKTCTVLRLLRKVTISYHVSFSNIIKICTCTTPHIWNDFDAFRAHSHPPKPPCQLRLATKTQLRCNTLKRNAQCHSHIQHQKHHSPNANPNVTAQKTPHLTKRCACAVKSSSTLQHLTFPHVSSLFHTNLTHHASIQNSLQTVVVAQTTSREQGSTMFYPQTPRVKREPFVTHSGTRGDGVPTPLSLFLSNLLATCCSSFNMVRCQNRLSPLERYNFVSDFRTKPPSPKTNPTPNYSPS